MPWIQRISVLVATCAVAVWCANSATDDAPAATDAPAALAWSPCADLAAPDDGRVWECATLPVPLDHARPDGPAIDLAVLRSRTADPARRLGSLVYNPGGPGGSGFEHAPAVAARFAGLLDRYDLVSWDPRGVGRSAPITCEQPELPARVPRTDAEWAELDAASLRFADSCVNGSGRLLPHVGLADSARDLDLIRAALGERRLDFLGVSYGGQLGAAYATLAPERVGRMVLDAPGTPLREFRRTLLDQAAGMEAALRDFVRFCLDDGQCPLGRDENAALDGTDRFLSALDTESSDLDRATATAALGIALSAPETWPHLELALGRALAGDGSELAGYAALFTGRRADGTFSNFAAANTAINCADYPDIYTVAQIRDLMPEFARVSPRFGELTGLRLAECARWPVHGVGRVALDGGGAPTVLVVGATGDPQARYEWVTEVAEHLRPATLLTYDGPGHGAYGGVDPCVDRVVEDYLREGVVPAEGARCP
ncbi:alpha/beta hydrolase [Nocardia puris]|uniref:Alpha/beta hydrolase family protein n=1 Tax=Nocardia puris TaxID=208602 RepID=A0A366DWL3_9NOCA|nr:alpha/beta hydrolase [Nocardia puris]RBO93684.1 alpha/beta hydrolase family protein [Nocardia puris]